MKLLNRQMLADGFDAKSKVNCAPLKKRPERVLQFGEGNFLRAFTCWMFDILNEKGLFDGSIVVVQPIASGQVSLLNQQEGLYTLVLRGMDAGNTVENLRLVSSISRGINPYEDWSSFRDIAYAENLRFVVSNTTEAGIAWISEPVPTSCPQSFPAKVTALLHVRYTAFGGHPEKGLVFLPCELIDRNGDRLRELVLRHAQAWGTDDGFQDWIRKSNFFLNTLVDRIVPGFPREEVGRLQEVLGYEDRLLDTGELFHLWVIEGPDFLAEELPFKRADLNVVWTSDLTPYRIRKVRILNGAHTATVLAGFLGGINTVGEMLAHPLFGSLVREAVFKEIVPALSFPEAEKAEYAKAVIERFQNPYIRHELLSISLNSVSKWRVRVLPSVLDYVAACGTVPPLLSFSMAALICFYRGTKVDSNEMRGKRVMSDESYAIRDEPQVLAVFEKAWLEFDKHHDCHVLVSGLLSDTCLWTMDLTSIPGFVPTVCDGLKNVLDKGMVETVQSLISETAKGRPHEIP